MNSVDAGFDITVSCVDGSYLVPFQADKALVVTAVGISILICIHFYSEQVLLSQPSFLQGRLASLSIFLLKKCSKTLKDIQHA